MTSFLLPQKRFIILILLALALGFVLGSATAHAQTAGAPVQIITDGTPSATPGKPLYVLPMGGVYQFDHLSPNCKGAFVAWVVDGRMPGQPPGKGTGVAAYCGSDNVTWYSLADEKPVQK